MHSVNFPSVSSCHLLQWHRIISWFNSSPWIAIRSTKRILCHLIHRAASYLQSCSWSMIQFELEVYYIIIYWQFSKLMLVNVIEYIKGRWHPVLITKVVLPDHEIQNIYIKSLVAIPWSDFPKGAGLLIAGGWSSDQWCEGGSLNVPAAHLLCTYCLLMPVVDGHNLLWLVGWVAAVEA